MKNMPSFRIARKSRNSRSLSITEMRLLVRKSEKQKYKNAVHANCGWGGRRKNGTISVRRHKKEKEILLLQEEFVPIVKRRDPKTLKTFEV
jgi:hypothetical protein